MAVGDTLLLGSVLLNYAHRMTRIIRDLLFIQATSTSTLIIGPMKLGKEQINDRKS